MPERASEPLITTDDCPECAYVLDPPDENGHRLCRSCLSLVIVGNDPAVGAPKNWRWGYLRCGCLNDGHGRHLR